MATPPAPAIEPMNVPTRREVSEWEPRSAMPNPMTPPKIPATTTPAKARRNAFRDGSIGGTASLTPVSVTLPASRVGGDEKSGSADSGTGRWYCGEGAGEDVADRLARDARPGDAADL